MPGLISAPACEANLLPLRVGLEPWTVMAGEQWRGMILGVEEKELMTNPVDTGPPERIGWG